MSRLRRRGRNWWQVLRLAIALFALVTGISAIPVVHQSELRLTDTYFRLAPPPRARSPVVLVVVDDESLRQYGRWPWSRNLLAQLTRNLAQSGASVIGLDILLSEPQSPAADGALRAALEDSGRTVVVDKIGTYADGPHWIEPLPEFAKAAFAVGHAQAIQDVDGVCRRFPALELTPDGARWAFALEVARRIDAPRAAAFLDTHGVPFVDDTPVVTTARRLPVPIAFRRDAFQAISASA